VSKISLLIMDDSDKDREFYIGLLNDSYPNMHKIREVGGIEGLSLQLLVDVPDCILLDSRSSVKQILDLLKMHKEYETIPVLILYSKRDEKFALEAVEIGAHDYILKNNLTALDLHRGIINTIEKSHLIKKVAVQEKKLENLESRDHLTGLFNRSSFEEVLEKQIARAKRYNEFFALLYIDIDDFKKVNDNFGHDIGDLFLKKITVSLKSSIGADDTLARFGGDEFAIIVAGIQEMTNAIEISKKIIAQLKEGYEIEGNLITSSASIGIACYPSAGDSVTQLLKNADIAMYKAKSKGKSCWQFFTDALRSAFINQLELEKALYKAIERKEFHMIYQPIYNLKTEKIAGVESLIRWNQSEIGGVMPDNFIPLAESIGIINVIGEWVMHETLSQFRAWKDMQCRNRFYLSINVSPLQLLDGRFITLLRHMLEKYRIEPSEIVLELTETAVIEAPKIIDSMNELAALGTRIAVDDFGTGYSSLKNLQDLPVHILKIDKTFVEKIGKDENSIKLIKSMLSISRHFGFKVTAEGVETKEQLQFLINHDCELGQGYYFSKGVLPEVFVKLLRQSDLR